MQDEQASAASRGKLKTSQRLDRSAVRVGQPAHIEHNLHVSQTRDEIETDRCDR